MKTGIDEKDFVASDPNPDLARAVIRQCGGFERFAEIAPEVASNGAECGFTGWIYYHETVPFARRNLAAIVREVERTAEDVGESAIQFVRSWRGLDAYTEDEVENILRGSIDDETILTLLAWFALEETSIRYVNYEQ